MNADDPVRAGRDEGGRVGPPVDGVDEVPVRAEPAQQLRPSGQRYSSTVPALRRRPADRGERLAVGREGQVVDVVEFRRQRAGRLQVGPGADLQPGLRADDDRLAVRARRRAAVIGGRGVGGGAPPAPRISGDRQDAARASREQLPDHLAALVDLHRPAVGGVESRGRDRRRAACRSSAPGPPA